MPISVTLCVLVSTANWSTPPSAFGARGARKMPKSLSVSWWTFTCGNAALTLARVEPTPTPLAFAPPSTMIVWTLRGRVSVRLTEPFSGATRRAARAWGPASSQPRVALRSFPALRSVV